MHFLQSENWEEFQKSLGRKTWRIQGVLIIAHNLIFGKTWFYVPRPSKEQVSVLIGALDEIQLIAKQEHAIFLRTDPCLSNIQFMKKYPVIPVKAEIQPKKTLVLDLSLPKEQLLAQMRKKTRYSIRYAEKHGIKIRISNKQNKKQFKQDFEGFWKLIQENAKNNAFKIYSKQYYWRMLKMPIAELFIAEANDVILSANIVIFFHKKAYGVHGANAFEMRNLRASYLMQWKRILEAKKRGCLSYDFWGIGPKWPGITKFKKGFGGRDLEYIKTHDFVFQPVWYKAYCLCINFF